MRLFRFHKSNRAEATAAREQAERDLAHTKDQREHVTALAGELRAMRERNHFAEALMALYHEER